jgi:S-DNA-T family DNA segregation ATPase FtsK/SpoIIIE
MKLLPCLAAFGLDCSLSATHQGPVVTTFDLELPRGTRVQSVSRLATEIALALRVPSVRVAAVGLRGVVAVEVPRNDREAVPFVRDGGAGSLPLFLGVDTVGAPVWVDLSKAPHLLVAGTTGSGKTVGLRGMIASLLLSDNPPELLLIDPKGSEVTEFADVCTILTEVDDAISALAALEVEMDRRYKAGNLSERRIVVVIDELADLLMTGKKVVESSIVRLAQKARGCGIHLICATQRPSVDVVTGRIKANFPSRIAYQLRTAGDSRVILDVNGAESLLGKGDGLYLSPGEAPRRFHGAMASDADLDEAVQRNPLVEGNRWVSTEEEDEGLPWFNHFIRDAALEGR